MFHIKYYLVDKTKKNVTGGAGSTYGGQEKCLQSFGGDTWGKVTTWKMQAQIEE